MRQVIYAGNREKKYATNRNDTPQYKLFDSRMSMGLEGIGDQVSIVDLGS